MGKGFKAPSGVEPLLQVYDMSRLDELLDLAAKGAASDFHEALIDWMEEATAELERQRRAIGTMASWLVQAQTGFGVKDAQGIEAILRGEK